MSASFTKVVVRLLGTIEGLFGAFALLPAFGMLWSAVWKGQVYWLAFVGFPLAVAAYGLYVGYLVWFRLTPLAVQHVCGTVGFLILILMNRWFEPLSSPVQHTPTWLPFAWLGALWAIYLLYRFAADRLSRALFAPGTPAAQN